MAGARRKARILALQTLYEIDSVGHKVEEVIGRLISKKGLSTENVTFAQELINGVLQNKERIDS